MTTNAAQRFVALDGVRGIAAIAVMALHITGGTGLQWVHRAWLSVDLFFCLSGFVIAHAYGQKITDGMGFKAFAKARVWRLAPVFLLGAVLGIAGGVIVYEQNSAEVSLPELITLSVFGLLLIPYFAASHLPFMRGTSDGHLYPLNSPSWSLFFELIANGFYYFFAGRSTRFFAGVALASLAVWVVTMVCGYSPNSGWDMHNFLGGFPRVMFSFCVGVMCHRFHRSTTLNLAPFAPWAVALMLVVFCLPGSKVITGLALLTLGPLVVLTNAQAQPSRHVASVLGWLGAISYPLYMIHFPLARVWGAYVLPHSTMPVWAESLALIGVGLLFAHGVVVGERGFRKQVQLKLAL